MKLKRTPFFSDRYWVRSGELECDMQPYKAPGRFRCSRCGWKSPIVILPPGVPPTLLSKLHKTCGVQTGRRIRRKPFGLGDSLSFWIHTITLGFVSMCAKCNSRRSRLNELVPYGRDLRWWRGRVQKWLTPKRHA